MEAGTPGRKSTEDGWLNRALRAAADPRATPRRAVAMTPNLPRTLAGAAPAVALASLFLYYPSRRQQPAASSALIETLRLRK
jgi:uncharacterized protein (DUF1501 family)